MKKIAVINDISGFGKCSLTAAIPIISAHKIQCCPLPTGVFSNQTGYASYKSVDLTDSLDGFIDEWRGIEAEFDGILTGFIPNSRQGEIISRFIDEFKKENTTVLVDPIMGDNGEIYPCYDDKSIQAVKEIVKKADIITPNLTELCLLTNSDYESVTACGGEMMLEKIKKMAESLSCTVIVTGIDASDNEIANAVVCNGTLSIVTAKRLGGGFSGTGDILASFVLAQYVNGEDIVNAVSKASVFIEKSIASTLSDKNEKYINADGIHFENMLDTI